MSPEMIPVLGMITGVLVTSVMTWGLVQMVRTWASTRRVQGGADPDLLAAVDTLREQVDHLQRQLDETQERLEFAERLMLRDRSEVSRQGGQGDGA
jgi:hypothetical protein